jgi:hypothetical protein
MMGVIFQLEWTGYRDKFNNLQQVVPRIVTAPLNSVSCNLLIVSCPFLEITLCNGESEALSVQRPIAKERDRKPATTKGL